MLQFYCSFSSCIGSERITSVALDSFFNSTAKIRQLLNGTCDELFNATFKEGIDTAKFTRVLPILKPQPAKSLLTVAYKLNNEDIDEDRLRVMQDILLYGQDKGTTVPTPENKTVPVEDEKDEDVEQDEQETEEPSEEE